MTMKKADWFAADKAMAERVQEYITKKGEFITIKARREAEINGLQAKIARYNDPSVVVVSDSDKKAELIASLEKELEDVKASYQKMISDSATFSFTDNDKRLGKAYKSAKDDTELADAICEWVKAYSKTDGTYLDLHETNDLLEICSALGGKRRVNARQHVQSGGTTFNGKRTPNDIINTFYGELAERMIKAGTLKAHTFPEEIRAKYAPKKRGNK